MQTEDKFIGAIRESSDSSYHMLKAVYKKQQEEQRELALRHQREWEEQQQLELERQLEFAATLEAERQHRFRQEQELLDIIDECRRRRWIHEPNTLLLGTYRDHPFEGLTLDIPDYLHDIYHDRRHLTEVPIWFRGDEMGITLGATGSGKFTSVIATNVMYFDGGVFCIDPKGEVLSVTSNARRKKFQRVYRLDPFEVTQFEPDAFKVPLASYNPLDALNPDEINFEDDVVSLVEIIVTPHESAGDTKFFVDQAKILLTALIMYVCTSELLEGQSNLAKVHEILCSSGQAMDFLFDDMEKSKFDTVRYCATKHRGMTLKTRDGIWLQAENDMALFSRPAIKRATSHSSFDLVDLFEGKCSVFVVLDNYRLDSHNRWIRLVMSAALMEAVRRYETKGRGASTLWIIDEARQLGSLSLIPRAYRLLRSYGIRMWTFWQSLQDLQSSFQQDWSSMLENSFVQLLSCNSLDTAKYFSELAGKYRETHISTTKSRAETWGTSSSFSTTLSSSGGVSKGPQGATFNSGSSGSSTHTQGTSHSISLTDSTTRSWQWAERIQTNDILTMPIDQMYLRCPGEAAGFANKHLYFNNEFLMTLASGNPFYGGPRQPSIFPRLEHGRMPEKEEYEP